MWRESKKYLFDMQQAAARIEQFTAEKALADYTSDVFLRSAVERQIEIVGEALARLAKHDEPTAQRISEYRRIISFRNVLIHGYDAISDGVTWDIVQSKLPVLRAQLTILLAEPDT